MRSNIGEVFNSLRLDLVRRPADVSAARPSDFSATLGEATLSRTQGLDALDFRARRSAIPPLPPELWTHIFGHLPPHEFFFENSIRRCRQVSRFWNQEVDRVQPSFINKVASVVAKRFLGSAAGALAAEEKKVLRQATNLDLGAIADIRRSSKNDMSGKVVIVLQETTCLQAIDLFGARMTPGEVADLPLHKLTSLKTLDYRQNGAEAACLPISNLINLRTLNLSMCSLHEVNVTTLPITLLVNLRTLKLSFNLLGREASFLPIGQLINLQTLDLDENHIDDDTCRNLPLDKLINLKHLNLNHNRIGAAGAGNLRIEKLFKLQTLNLGWNTIGDVGACALRIGALKELQILNLFENQIGDAGARGLQIAQLYEMRDLNLNCNKISNAGACELPVSRLRKLRDLYLRSNRISGEVKGIPADPAVVRL